MDDLKNIKGLLGFLDSVLGGLNQTTNYIFWVYFVIALCIPFAWGILWILVEKGII